MQEMLFYLIPNEAPFNNWKHIAELNLLKKSCSYLIQIYISTHLPVSWP